MNTNATVGKFTKGEVVTFKYHDKLRFGMVDKVGKTFVTLRHERNDESTGCIEYYYKSYSFNKIILV